MARFGLDYETISKNHPGLIMYSTCIRGQVGPEQLFPGTGAQGGALCGMESITGWPDRPPSGVHGAYTDVIVPRFGAALLVGSLMYRDRTGRGQHIDMPQVEPGIRFLEPLVLDYTVNGCVAAPNGQHSLYSCPRGVYRTRGTERYVAIEVETPAQWRALVRLAPLQEFESESLASLEARIQRQDEIDSALRAWCIEQDAEELATRLQAEGVPASVAYFPSELLEHPQLAHREFFVPLEHGEMGTVRYDGLASHFSETPGRLRNAAPCLGQDTHRVLTKLLGLTEDEVSQYAEKGALH
jgi:benzylsuccinate CoA-transferase BbsF subunit